MIPLTKPFFDENEIRAVKETIVSGWVAQGPKVKQFEDTFAVFTNSKYSCAVSSCTTALHIALLAVGVKPGDTVITVSHSFIATANSIRHCGAEPVFIDIDSETFNMSCQHLERLLDENCQVRKGVVFYKSIGRVACIMPVHQLGMPCDLRGILSIAKKYNIPVVEDAACAVGSEISMDNGKTWERIGKPHGDIACFSFHPRKLITTGEGGILTTNNPEHDRTFRLLRHHGMSVSDVARSAAKKVIFEEYIITGYNYRMSDLQASLGIEQLRKLPTILEDRRRVVALYKEKLQNIDWLKLPQEPTYARTNWQSFPIRILENAPRSRNELMQILLDSGISTRRGVMNAHQEKPYKSHISLKNSELARDSVILLPLFFGIKEEEIEKIAEVLKNV